MELYQNSETLYEMAKDLRASVKNMNARCLLFIQKMEEMEQKKRIIERTKQIKKELMENCFHPNNIHLFSGWGIDLPTQPQFLP